METSNYQLRNLTVAPRQLRKSVNAAEQIGRMCFVLVGFSSDKYCTADVKYVQRIQQLEPSKFESLIF